MKLVAEFLPKTSCQVVDGSLEEEARILALDLGRDRGLTDFIGEPQSFDPRVNSPLRGGIQVPMQRLERSPDAQNVVEDAAALRFRGVRGKDGLDVHRGKHSFEMGERELAGGAAR